MRLKLHLLTMLESSITIITCLWYRSQVVADVSPSIFFSRRDNDGSDPSEDYRQRRVEGDPAADQQRQAVCLRGTR